MSYAAAARACLVHELAPIAHLLSDPSLTDLQFAIGRKAFADRGNGLEPVEMPYQSFADLDYIARLAAAMTGQDIAPDVPEVSTAFPCGHRVQISRPPVAPDGEILFSIRRPVARAWSLAELVEKRTMTAEQACLIHDAVLNRDNILFTGLVGAGKTTVLRSAIHEAPLTWRLVTIEDSVREIIGLMHENVEHLLYSKGGQSAAGLSVTAESLVESAMRKGMDGLLMQEVRDKAAYAFWGALKSGHWAMTTAHSDSAGDAFERLAGLVKEHPAGMHHKEGDVIASLRRCIRLVVHCQRDGDRRYVREVLST